MHRYLSKREINLLKKQKLIRLIIDNIYYGDSWYKSQLKELSIDRLDKFYREHLKKVEEEDVEEDVEEITKKEN